MIRESGMNATILRPWYVLGPGRRWPIFLKPMYWFMERVPPRGNRRIGSRCQIEQMVSALVRSIEILQTAYESRRSRDSRNGVNQIHRF